MPVTNYVWDGDQYLMETDETNTTQAVFTNEPDEYTNLISQRRDGATQYPHFDALGSTRQLTNAAEAITDVLLYDAWGNVLVRVGVTIFPLQFVGRVGYFFDPDTNTFCIIFRIYEPETGRWGSLDLLFSDGFNRYLYAKNRPTSLIDPNGLKCQIALHCWDVKVALFTIGRHCGFTIKSDLFPFAGEVWVDGLPRKTGGFFGFFGRTWLEIVTGVTPEAAKVAKPPNYWESGFGDFNDSVCRCLSRYIDRWNKKEVPYANDGNGVNSNCALRCMAEECNIELTWNNEPTGFRCNYCEEFCLDNDTGLLFCNSWTRLDCKKLEISQSIRTAL